MVNVVLWIQISLLVLVLIIIVGLNMQFMHAFFVQKYLETLKRGHLTIYDYNSRLILDIHKSNEYRGILYVKDWNNFCSNVYNRGEVGLGEMYVDDQWKSPNITELLILLLELWVENQTSALSSLNAMSQSHTTDKDDIKYHYDMGNDFYMTFLVDDLHAYSCGFFFCETDDMNRAQYNKVDEVIRKLEVKPGERVLDVGCGWGSIANYVAKKTKATVHGITLSDEQEKYSLKHYPDVYVKNISYVDMSIDVRYDKIYSIGMFEHVRCENYNLFFEKMFDLLEPNGRMVLHTITHGMKPNNSTCAYQNEVYVTKHIFPGGQIPNIEWITKAASAAGFRLAHMESYGGQHYAKTLRTWRSYMMAKKEYILSLGYTAEQIRSYEYYMAGCEANFLNDGMCIHSGN